MITKISNGIIKYIALIFFGYTFYGCAGLRNDYKLYCKKGDVSSVRIIPKKDPFTPVVDSVNKYISLSVSGLSNYSSKIDVNKKQVLVPLIQQIDNKTFLNLSYLKSIYEGYRSRPCDDSAYKDYQQNLSKYQEYLLNIKDLYKDIEQITKASGISGSNSSMLIDRVSEYLITRDNGKN